MGKSTIIVGSALIILLFLANCGNVSNKSLKENLEGSYSYEEEDEKIKNTYVIKIEFASGNLYKAQIKVFSMTKSDNDITEHVIATDVFQYNEQTGNLEITEKGKLIKMNFSDDYKKLFLVSGENQKEYIKQ